MLWCHQSVNITQDQDQTVQHKSYYWANISCFSTSPVWADIEMSTAFSYKKVNVERALEIPNELNITKFKNYFKLLENYFC